MKNKRKKKRRVEMLIAEELKIIRKTIPCKWCGEQTPMLDTKTCNKCWELETRILANINLTKKMISALEEKTKDGKRIRVLEIIAADMKNDATNFDGQLFNKKTVAEYFGNQGAAITALANIVKSILEQTKEES